jgi:signal transduction histidine kinase/L-ascorbate metabolism protein UlaG (beta-lactamase superfamily)
MDLETLLRKHVRRTGNAGLAISTDDTLLLIDPFMNTSNIKAFSKLLEEGQGTRVAAFSHGHYDHGFRSAEVSLLLDKGFTLLVPQEIRELGNEIAFMADSHKERFDFLKLGESRAYNGITISSFHAEHAKVNNLEHLRPMRAIRSKLASINEHFMHPLRYMVGYDVSLAGFKLTHLGSLGPADLSKTDVLFLPLTEKPSERSLYPEYSLERKAIDKSSARIIVPIHDDYMDHLLGEMDAGDFRSAVSNVVEMVPIYSSPEVMKREICCGNFPGLLEYVERTPHMPSGLAGKDALIKLLTGIEGNPRTKRLIDNPDYKVRIPDRPWEWELLTINHFRDPSVWISNDCSVQLFANAREVIGGYRPLYHPGTFSGLHSMQHKTIGRIPVGRMQIGRLLGAERMMGIAARMNAQYNATKVPKLRMRDGVMHMDIEYFRRFKGKITRDVCDWYAGMVAGMGTFIGTRDALVEEVACVTEGAPACTFRLGWKELGFVRRLYTFGHSLLDPGYAFTADENNLTVMDAKHRLEGNVQLRTEEERGLRKRAEEQRERAEVALIKLKEAQDMLIQFEKRAAQFYLIDGVAHEVNTPLQAILGANQNISGISMDYLKRGLSSIDALIRNPEMRDDALRQIGEVRTEIEEIFKEYQTPGDLTGMRTIIRFMSDNLEQAYTGIKIIKSIVTSLKSTAERRSFDIKKEDLSAIVNETVAYLKKNPSIGSRLEKVSIRYDYSADNEVYCDHWSITQALTAAVINSLDAMEAKQYKEEAPCITFRTQLENENIRLILEDNGVGIEETELRRIFDQFYTKKAKGQKGTGLGLSGFAGIVVGNNGTYSAESEYGMSTRIIMKLPRLLKG